MKKYQLLALLLIVLLGGFLRFYQIQNDPPGLYIDEASIGYNAYTILNSGKDQYGTPFPLFFRSFGDYKPPIYIYAVSGAMLIFGKSEFAVRFPSALAGILTVLVFYFFLKKILELDKSLIPLTVKKYLPILSSFLLSTSMWHIHFSRGGFEVTMAFFIFITASYLALLFWDRKKRIYLISSYFLYAIAMYTYYSFRSPITWIFITVLFIIHLPKHRKIIFLAGTFFILLVLPLIIFSMTANGSERLLATSAFSEYTAPSILNKLFIYPMVYLKNYFSFFSLDYLFNSGDGNGRHQIPGFGLLFRWQFPFMIIGFAWLVKQKKSLLKYIILGLLLIAPIPAAVARPSPHSLRALQLILSLTTFTSTGLIIFLKNFKKWRKVALLVITIFALYEFAVYLHFYYFHYPNVNSLDWGGGYKQAVIKASKMKEKYRYIVVDQNLTFARAYFDFYDDSIKPVFVDTQWQKPKKWGDKQALYIRPFYGKNSDSKIIDQVYLPGPNKTVFAQFWEL